MRFEICASATLLAVQLLQPATKGDGHHSGKGDGHHFGKGDGHHFRRDPTRPRPNAAEAAKLEALWLAHNAGFHPPDCEQYDPLAVLDADVDPVPGREHVIGNRRFGVAMYSEQGVLIARMKPIGCAVPADGDQSMSLSSHGRLIVRTRELLAGVDETLIAHVVEREEDELVDLIAIDLGGDSGERQVTGAMYFSGGEVEVKYHGRERAEDGTWRAVDEHCTWDLATRSSSCRRQAAARR